MDESSCEWVNSESLIAKRSIILSIGCNLKAKSNNIRVSLKEDDFCLVWPSRGRMLEENQFSSYSFGCQWIVTLLLTTLVARIWKHIKTISLTVLPVTMLLSSQTTSSRDGLAEEPSQASGPYSLASNLEVLRALGTVWTDSIAGPWQSSCLGSEKQNNTFKRQTCCGKHFLLKWETNPVLRG